MSNDNKDENSEGNIEGAINAVAGLVKEVPIYQDALQPAAKEIGKTLFTITKTVNVALSPVSVLIWSYDQIKDFVDNKVSEKLQNVPLDNIITPPAHIAGPALESLRYTGAIEELKELYANLIASSMDSSTTELVHPSFVEIIKQLSAPEALLLKAFISKGLVPIITIRSIVNAKLGGYDEFRHFSTLGEETNCSNHELIPNHLDNLCRLGIIEIPELYQLTDEEFYKPLEEHPIVLKIKEKIIKEDNRKPEIKRKTVILTGLGELFIETCVQDHQDI